MILAYLEIPYEIWFSMISVELVIEQGPVRLTPDSLPPFPQYYWLLLILMFVLKANP